MFDVKDFDVKKFDEILSRGLSYGLQSGDQVCIEAAICQTLGLGLSDDPKCVASSVRQFKISLNDSIWSSPEARAKGLRNLGLAQLGSLGVVSDDEFVTKLSERMIRILIPTLFREVFSNPPNPECLEAAHKCEFEGTVDAAEAASDAADGAAVAATAATDAYYSRAAAEAAADNRPSEAASYAAYVANSRAADFYLGIAAKLALDTLIELNSPGISLLDGK